MITLEGLIRAQQPCSRNADERVRGCLPSSGRNKVELLMLILEHFSPVFKLLDKTLEIWWLLPGLIKINKMLVADFVKSLFLFFHLV